MTKKGFTLIELLVVLSIISLLASLVVNSMSDTRKKSRDVKRISDIRSLENALHLYQLQNNIFPSALSSLAPTFISAIPIDPDGTSYRYAALRLTTSAPCNGYHLGTRATGLETSSVVLSTDADATSAGTLCSGSAANFAGTDPVYDKYVAP
ncbi:MAG: prepilin-type N-terminal cleavage/methylation domain-containing protein [bacterium]|nr:prepilin-type N-terminal cleavage/methylation domain-containing protein [bacterium]